VTRPPAASPTAGQHDADPERVVTVRYWAAARAAAERSEDVVAAGTLADVLAQLRERHRHRPRLVEVLAISSLLIGDRPAGSADPADVQLNAGDVIEVLPPFAGG
jgi:sulfur-carrier protein